MHVDEPASKTDLLDKIQTGWQEWQELLSQVNKEQMEQPGAEGEWSVKDIIAHITWSERGIVPLLEQHILSGSELWNLSQDERNTEVYRQNRYRPLDEVLAESQNTHEQLIAAARDLDEQDLTDSSRFTNMPADWLPWMLISGNTYAHYRDHIQSVKVWLAQKGG